MNLKYYKTTGDVTATILDSLKRDEYVGVVITDDVRLSTGKRIPQGARWSFWVDFQSWQIRPRKADSNLVRIDVEDLPEPIGGIAAIQNATFYPSMALQNGIQGTVPPGLIATFTASSIGSLKGTSIRSNPFS